MGQLVVFVIMLAAIPKIFGLASALFNGMYNSLLGGVNSFFTPKNKNQDNQNPMNQ